MKIALFCPQWGVFLLFSTIGLVRTISHRALCHVLWDCLVYRRVSCRNAKEQPYGYFPSTGFCTFRWHEYIWGAFIRRCEELCIFVQLQSSCHWRRLSAEGCETLFETTSVTKTMPYVFREWCPLKQKMWIRPSTMWPLFGFGWSLGEPLDPIHVRHKQDGWQGTVQHIQGKVWAFHHECGHSSLGKRILDKRH